MSEGAFSFRGSVQRIISYGGKAGAIFLVEPLNSAFGDLIKVKLNGDVQSIAPTLGEVWDINGAYDSDTTYGEQIVAEVAFPILPSGRVLIEFIGKNPKFAGIGVGTAKKMWMAFGEKLYDILTNEDEELLLRKIKLNDTLVEILFETWKKYEQVIPVVKFFHSLGFNAKLASKAMGFWGSETVEKIKEDPYRMLAFGGWEKVDVAAREKLNVSCDAHIRLIAAVEEALYKAYDDKHTAQDYTSLAQRTKQLLGGSQSAEMAINLALSDGRVQAFEKSGEISLYQVAGARAMERYIPERIAKISQGEKYQLTLFQKSFSEKRLEEFESKLPYPLAEEQRLAIKMIAEHPFAVIVGGAGVGKTTVLRGIYHMLPENAVIIQAALTNRAASRMSESTGLDAMSIAKLLITASEDGLPANAHFFIDEASMLDVPTFYRILKALPAGSRLYLVGDHHQLPPIGPGLVLHQLVDEGYPHITELTKVHRQANDTGIPIVASAIRNMKPPSLEKFESGQSNGVGVSIYPTNDKSTLIDAVLTAYRELYSAGETQIVAARNDTCSQLNIALHLEHKAYLAYCNIDSRTIEAHDVELCEGDKIVYKDNNDLSRDLFNGSLGVLTRIYANPVSVTNRTGDIKIAVAEAEFDTAGTVQLGPVNTNFVKIIG
ncbi:MAG: AAA family ATPase [Candidatus Thiodiazotropha endolucinida]|nr:AAA family ATPase [Candidatus Thiodiazotropha taylori]MCG8094201.1 AAA family ATPase [Candidatus Thiodiazotropha endolucinida]MCG8047667.1 AAA family ATPase [Candidatus Thiodiazotropha taylori]MCG8053731.1 AAA family ATPase [Candidatus Thiodiazotropha taylori]MCW4315551.1 AAA family ATPase [Candidatus Thiodiazotropha taylori]